ncbi:MAG: hypothetical protein IT435_16630 [Phycisphaerales bacterium]|nr:hypothetical protein [Phycisphaerales bacterium]
MPPDALPPIQSLTTTSPGGGIVRAIFQALSPQGHAEVGPIPGDPPTPPAGGGSVTGIPNAGLSMNLGWMWVNGQRPVVKTRRLILAADGTTFFTRSTANLDQFYFIGPATSRVKLTLFPAILGRPSAFIDTSHKYAECAGASITVRALNPASPADAEFLAVVNQARIAAEAAGIGSE